MKNILATLMMASGLASLAGCSSLPDVKVGYYLPKGAAAITLTQTAACTSDNKPVVVSDATFTPFYSKDATKHHFVNLDELDGPFTKADASFQFHSDGRLKSINTKQTGGGDVLVKTLIKVIPAATGMLIAVTPAKESCETLKTLLHGDQYSVTVVHTGVVTFSDALTDSNGNRIPSFDIPLKQQSLPENLYHAMGSIFGIVSAKYSLPESKPEKPHEFDHLSGQAIALVEPMPVPITITINRGKDYKQKELTGSVLVPQYGTEYWLPVPSAPFFGENEFEVVIGESGRVDKLRYSGGSGGTSIAGSLTDISGAFAEETAAEKAASVKADADLIFQQQRLVICQTNPQNCPA